MSLKRQNCWQYKRCGREPGGENAQRLGVCPAATDTTFEGINQGKCAGRFCWAVAGTLCNEDVQGTFAEKRGSCIRCDFYQRVQAEEGTANLRSKFFKFVRMRPENPLVNSMSLARIPAGKRFIRQGDVSDRAYIIQRGSCMVIVEKDGVLHPVGHRGESDIVGIMSLLTGEKRHAHVEAETELDVWVLDKEMFEGISKDDPDMMAFLTELVADRFDSRRPTADRRIGKYIATQIVGRGGYSIVYKGHHELLKIPAAIKMMRHDLAMDPDFMNIFWNEAKTIAAMRHDNIIRIYDIEERFRTLFIIMEYCEGESLADLIARIRKIPPSVAAHYLSQICSGLDYAHQRGIVHRDINPSNIIVQPNDRLKILDFGLACPAGRQNDTTDGTVHYMAPEQIRGETLDARTDIYSLGIMAFEMVMGKRPFPEKDLLKLQEMHLTQQVPDPAKQLRELPEELRLFILKACRKRPSERFQSVREAMESIGKLGRGYPIIDTKPKNRRRDQAILSLMFDLTKREMTTSLIEEFQNTARELGMELKVESFPDR